MFSGKTIFISPLDWGLGHATRCVPLVRSISENNKVIIGVTPLTRQIFDSEFPDLQQMDVPAYDVSYSSNLPVWLSLLASWPKIRWVIWKEKQFVTRKLESLNIDVIISDNRF